MDNSHVALVAVKLLANGLNVIVVIDDALGVNLTSLTKVLKCAKDDDICTIKASDEADLLNLVYEAKSMFFFLVLVDVFVLLIRFIFFFSIIFMNQCSSFLLCTDSDRIAEYDMKLMDIDSDTLGIPDTEYDARVTMPPQSSLVSSVISHN